jgi:hypothetical protein
MNTKNVARTLVSKLKRVLLAALVAIVLFSSLPVGEAHAASGSSYSSIKCGIRSFDVNLNIRGAYDGQWVKYRLVTRTVATGAITYTPWSQAARVYGIAKNWFSYPHAVTRNTVISVYPEILYWNGVAWERPTPIVGPHYEPWAGSMPNTYPRCTVLA